MKGRCLKSFLVVAGRRWSVNYGSQKLLSIYLLSKGMDPIRGPEFSGLPYFLMHDRTMLLLMVVGGLHAGTLTLGCC